MKHESLINKSNSNSICAEKNSETAWIISLEEDPDTGDMILPLPDELLESQGWKIGDTLVWDIVDDGVAILTKKNDG